MNKNNGTTTMKTEPPSEATAKPQAKLSRNPELQAMERILNMLDALPLDQSCRVLVWINAKQSERREREQLGDLQDELTEQGVPY